MKIACVYQAAAVRSTSAVVLLPGNGSWHTDYRVKLNAALTKARVLGFFIGLRAFPFVSRTLQQR
jgi:hypothetical protein